MMYFAKHKTGPSWSMKPRHKDREPDEKPAAGAYDPAPEEKATTKFKLPPRWGFGTGTRFGFTEGLANQGVQPGPGRYSPYKPKQGPGPYGFGTNPRGTLNYGDNPGPGSYELVESMGPQAAFRSL